MDTKQFFLNPEQTHQRHYEALRAIHLDNLTIKQAAQRFHFSAAYLKKLNAQFRQDLIQGAPNFFVSMPQGRPPGSAAPPQLAQEIIAMRKYNRSVPDIHSALAAKGEKISLTAIDRLLKQEGFAPLPRRTRQERAHAALPAIIAGTAGKETTFGTVVGRVKSEPFTYCRVSTDDFNGMISVYLGEGELTNDPLDTFGGYGVAKIPNLQGLLKYICENGFEHHTAVNLSQVARPVDEALGKYMEWDVYHHR